MAVKIVHEIDKCIGCGACAAVCPDNWEMAGDKAKPKQIELQETQIAKKDASAKKPGPTSYKFSPGRSNGARTMPEWNMRPAIWKPG